MWVVIAVDIAVVVCAYLAYRRVFEPRPVRRARLKLALAALSLLTWPFRLRQARDYRAKHGKAYTTPEKVAE